MTKQRNKTDWRSTNRRKNSKLPLVPRNQVRPRKLTHTILYFGGRRTLNIRVQMSASAREGTMKDSVCGFINQTSLVPSTPEHRPPPAARTTVLLCQRLLVLPENGYRMIICNSDFLFAIRRCRLGGWRCAVVAQEVVEVARTSCTKSIMPAAVSPRIYAHKHNIYTRGDWWSTRRVGVRRRIQQYKYRGHENTRKFNVSVFSPLVIRLALLLPPSPPFSFTRVCNKNNNSYIRIHIYIYIYNTRKYGLKVNVVV